MLEIPTEGVWGFILEKSGFLAFQVQRMDGNKYVDIPTGARIDNYPEVKVDTLYMNDTRSFAYQINRLYYYTKGTYRIRVLARLSDLNAIEDLYSEWIYLECKK